MKQRSAGEDAIKELPRQVKLEEILLPDSALGVGTRHGNKTGCALQPDGIAALEVASWPANKIDNGEGRLAFGMSQQRSNVLADVVIACASPKLISVLLVVRERNSGDLVQVVPFKRLDMHRGVSAFDHSPLSRL